MHGPGHWSHAQPGSRFVAAHIGTRAEPVDGGYRLHAAHLQLNGALVGADARLDGAADVPQAARLAWEEAVQMHGAIGMTDEYRLSHYVKLLASAQMLYGDAEHHLERQAVVEDQVHLGG